MNALDTAVAGLWAFGMAGLCIYLAFPSAVGHVLSSPFIFLAIPVAIMVFILALMVGIMRSMIAASRPQAKSVASRPRVARKVLKRRRRRRAIIR
jgi:hypothetical protein